MHVLDEFLCKATEHLTLIESNETMTVTIDLEDRYLGAMVGLACGDAVGTTVEFCARGTFEPVVDMVGGGPFGLKPGQWTDDTNGAVPSRKPAGEGYV